jgi:E-phenylitaconyl-CoA hydratase
MTAPRIERRLRVNVASLIIDNPDSANALTAGMKIELAEAWAWIDETPDIHVAVLTGAGERHFCAGADVRRLADQGAAGESATAHIPFAPHMGMCRKPIIAVVNGATAGAAIGLVADADVVLASRNAYFTDPHIDIGIVTGYGCIRLAGILPSTEVRRLALGGRSVRLNAERAYRLGFVNELLDTPGLARNRAQQIAESIAARSTWAVQTSLELLRSVNSTQTVTDRARDVTDREWGRQDVRAGTAAWNSAQRTWSRTEQPE